MRHKINFIFALLLCATSLVAQEVKQTTLENLIPGGSDYLYTESIYGLKWWGDVCLEPSVESIQTIDPKSGSKSVLTTLEAVNSILKKDSLTELSNLYSVTFPWPKEKSLLFKQNNNYIKVNLKSKSSAIIQVSDNKAENIDYQTGSNHIAYTIDRDLFVNNKPITKNPEGVVSGQTVHRSEFGITKGTFWSPSGQLLAFYHKDERMVTDYPLVDMTSRIATVENFKYPMAGMDSHLVSIGIHNPNSNKTIYLKTGDATDRYFTNISWAPSEKSIYLIELNRDQNHAKLCEYSVDTGDLIQVLLEEKHTKYVEPQNPITFLPWNDKLFIYQSERSGFNHLYLYNTKGELQAELTNGEWLVKNIVGFNSKEKEIIITTTKHSPLQSNLQALSIKNKKLRDLDNREGVHSADLSLSGLYYIDNYSTPEVPRKIELVTTKNLNKTVLLTAENPLSGFMQPNITIGTIKAADHTTDLYYRLTLPSNLDKSKKHPVIIYVYGGPHAQMINSSWNYGARGWDLYMANEGYIVFSLDNRGSDNRGFEFESATFRELGIKEGEDQVEGVKFLKSLPYADTDRIGVHGWSFGGHMTTALMLRYPDLFKVGVAGGSVTNWAYYEIMYGERYMDTPQSNPEGYNKTNLSNYADQLRGSLLMIHNGHDPVCVPQHTYSFIKACVDVSTYPDLFVYPGHQHNVIGKDRVHLYQKVTQYFKNKL